MASAYLVAGARLLASGQEESSQTPLQVTSAGPFGGKSQQEPGKAGPWVSWLLTNQLWVFGFCYLLVSIVLFFSGRLRVHGPDPKPRGTIGGARVR